MSENWLDDYKTRFDYMKTLDIVKDDAIATIDETLKIIEEVYEHLNKNPIEDLSMDEGAIWLLAITLSQTRDVYSNIINDYNNLVNDYNDVITRHNDYKTKVNETKNEALRMLDTIQRRNDKFILSLFSYL